MSFLVVQTSFLGDLVLTTPLIASLAERGAVDVVTTPAGAPLLANHPAVRRVIVYDKRRADAGFGGLWRMARTLRAGRYDAAYMAQGSVRSAALVVLAGIREIVGFNTSAGRFLYTRRVRYAKDRHHAERLWTLGARAGEAPAGAIAPRLYPGEAERASVDRLLRDVPRDGAPYLALAPGSIWGTKRWPHFPALAKRMAPVYRIIVVGGADDAPLAAEIAAAAGSERIVDATGELTLLASAELLARCAALVTNDSAPQHLASAVGTPTLTLFGPTVPAFGFGPLAPRHDTAGVEGLACRPCDSHGPAVCPLGHWRCMRDLDVSHIEGAVHALLHP
ncbi:MAG: lipopolysaccharide heptosyltransferase II [Gemmatimonadetes bacterium]|nr:lipopolysaccharide heptosyltransferase II [Gemmatimonadota bacterium]